MRVSELISALEQALLQHGDLPVGYYASPGAASFAPIIDVERLNTEWREDQPERTAIVLWNGGD